MKIFRKALKGLLRISLLIIAVVFLLWIEIRVSRAYYRRAALQPPASFIVENTPVIALTHTKVIDGTGAPALEDQTVILASGKIVAFGACSSVKVPNGARELNLSGKTVLPGLVMLHEHLFTTSSELSAAIHGIPKLLEQSVPFPLMYLAAGVTTMRTAGSIDPAADLALKHAIDSGQRPGPDMYLTAPYLDGKPSPESAPYYYPQMRQLADAAEAANSVDFWSSRGMTSFKAYTDIAPSELSAAINRAHAHGMKVTGHLCSIGFSEAADLGIDNLEHGIMVDEEFFPGKRPGLCPDIVKALEYFDSHLEINSPQVEAMMRHLIEHRVAITSTLAVDADFSGAMQPLDVMRNRELRALGWRSWLMYRMIRRQLEKRPLPHLLTKEMRFEREFAAAGGTLLAGSDPTGDGGMLAGYGDQREIELLVHAGFTPEEAIHISTANGAEFLGEASRIGTIAVGKQADLFVVRGDPSRHISDIRNVELVFRKGVGYSSSKLFAAVRGLVGMD